jgi:hypothetical protein
MFADCVVETSNAIVQQQNEHSASKRCFAGIVPIAELSRVLQPEEVAKNYPMLHHLNVDLSSVLQIHGLMRDILNLAKELDAFSLLDFPCMNSKPCTVIAILKCSQKDYFNATAKKWIFRMLDGLIDTRSRNRGQEKVVSGAKPTESGSIGGTKRSGKKMQCTGLYAIWGKIFQLSLWHRWLILVW